MLRITNENYLVLRERKIQRMNSVFLALKFKIRYRLRFEKKFGNNQKRRFQKFIQRGFCYGAMNLQIAKKDAVGKVIVETVQKIAFII